jgi:AcrR family transcriptional regulator
MGRPANTDPADTRRRILASARASFARYGVAGASLREIAAGAGITVATLSHHFGSKEGLHRACVAAFEEQLGALGKRLAEALGSAASDPVALFTLAVREGWRFARAHRDDVRMLQRSIAEAGEIDAATRGARIVPFLETVSGYLAGATGRDAAAFRLALQSSTFLVVRYAISSDAELAELAAAPAKAPPEAIAQAIEDHLVEAVLRLLALRAGRELGTRN